MMNPLRFFQRCLRTFETLEELASAEHCRTHQFFECGARVCHWGYECCVGLLDSTDHGSAEPIARNKVLENHPSACSSLAGTF